MKKIFDMNKSIAWKRLLPVTLAAVTAAVGFSSCAALEMLDSMAAGDDNTNDTPAYTVAAQTAPPTTDEAADSTVTDETAPAEDSEQDAIDVITGIFTGDESEEGGESADTAQNGGTADPEELASASVPEFGQSTVGDSSMPEDNTYLQVADNTSSMTDSSIYSADAYTVESNSGDMPAGGGGVLSAYLAYSDIVRRTAEHVAADPSYQKDFCKYYITDIDDNGVYELLVETGTIEADRTVYVYTFDGSQPVPLGNFVSWHTTLGDGDGVIYSETAAMGSYLINTIRIQDGKLFTERNSESTSTSQLTRPLASYDLNDRSALETLRN